MDKRKRVRFISIIITILLIGTILMPLSVLAIVAPDNIDVLATYVYRNLLEDGDRLYVFQYELEYAVYPTDYNIDTAFIFNLYATDGTTLLGSTLAYPYWNESPGDALGYGQGVISFYFSDADNVAPNFNEAYILTVVGNPLVFGVPPSESFVVAVGNYTTLTTQADNKLALANAVRTMAGDLETQWSVTLLDEQEGIIVLSSYGEEYFTNAIYGLRSLAPALFYVQEVEQDMSRRTWTTDYADDLAAGVADTQGETIDGSFIETGLEAGGDLLGVGKQIFGSIIAVGCVVGVMIFSVVKLDTTWLGWIFAALITTGFVRLSFIHMTAVAIIGLFLVISTLWAVFGRNA